MEPQQQPLSPNPGGNSPVQPQVATTSPQPPDNQTIVASPAPVAANFGLNQTPVLPVKQADSSKGFWKWIMKLSGAGAASQRLQADTQQAQAYATQHNLQYEATTQKLPTGSQGTGSALLSKEGNTVFYFHLSGLVQDHSIDTITWFHRHFKTTAHGFTMGNQQNFPEVDTVLAGRVTIKQSVPSLIVASRTNSLLTADPAMFTQFRGADKVQLEGDFNSYFSVYAPQDDPVSAFQSLPPNLMVTLIEEFKDLCIEFVGNSIYILQVTNSTRSSYANRQPSFVASDYDRLTARLLRLASFFNNSPQTVPVAPLDPTEVITNQPIPTIHIS